MKKTSQFIIFILFTIIILAILWIFITSNRTTTQLSSALPSSALITASPTQTEEKIIKKSSSDGTVSFIETIQKISGGNTRYTFTTTDQVTGSAITIFDTSEDSSTSYIVPDNSWSPDNKQFFIIKSTPSSQTYLVFKADGTKYSNGDQYYDVADLWSKAKHTSKIMIATGWGGGDLLILQTANADGNPGPDFWFVTSIHGFLQLRQL